MNMPFILCNSHIYAQQCAYFHTTRCVLMHTCVRSGSARLMKSNLWHGVLGSEAFFALFVTFLTNETYSLKLVQTVFWTSYHRCWKLLGYVLDCGVWQALPGGAGVVPVHRARQTLEY